MTDTIKKTALTLAGLAALGFGGAQLANATSGSTPAPITQPANAGDHNGDQSDASETVTGAAAEKAKAAALAKVPGGTVTQLQAETADDHRDQADTPEPGDQPDAADEADTPEAGDKADPAYESKIAYDVEVTAADGTVTDVHLDQAFAVLGTENEGKEGSGE